MKLDLIRLSLVAVALVLMSACATQQGGADEYGESKLSARARSHTDLGAAYYQQNKLEIALDEFNHAISIDPNYGQAYNGLGLVYAALNEDAKADANFKKAIQTQPNSSESHNNYGSFLCSRKRYDESIAHFLEAVKNPLYATPNIAYANAGICSARKNDVKNAEIYLNKALQIEPLTHSAAVHLAEIQFNRGDAKTAQKTLQNTLVASPGPEALWLGIKIERALGGKDNEASYALQLRQQYPNSEQARLLLSGQ
ncbi:MAG: type IV pilus biogenesis/stability protein PilW [Methylotenera sp.]